jgi:hypothetical protein
MHKMRILLLVCLVATTCSGCARDWYYSAVNELRACHAWSRSGCDDRGEFHHDFRAGWERGYFDVSTGKSGDSPVLPPKKYWSPRYQTPEGSQAIEAWYQGYQQGSIAGDQDGFGTRHALPARLGGFAPGANCPFENGVEVPVDDPSACSAEGDHGKPAAESGEEMPKPQSSLSRRLSFFRKPQRDKTSAPLGDAPMLVTVPPASAAVFGGSVNTAPGFAGGEDSPAQLPGTGGQAAIERTPKVVKTSYLATSGQAGSEQP